MKENSFKWLLILLLLCLAIFLVVVMVLLLLGNKNPFTFFHLKGETKIVLEEKYDIEKINKIKINTTVADIKFLPSEEKNAKVVIYAEEKEDVESTLEENTLKIDSNKKNRFCFGFCFFGKEEILIYLPENEIKEIEAKTVSGDIQSSISLNADMKLKSTSGDISLKNAEDVDIHTTSGDIEVGNIKNTSIASVSGEVNVDTIIGKMNITTTSGDIEIHQLDCQSDSEIKTVSGEVRINKLSHAYVETKSVSGDADIVENDRTAEHTLKIKTTSGDIKVN